MGSNHEKNRGRKSRDTVRLRKIYFILISYWFPCAFIETVVYAYPAKSANEIK